MATSSIEYDPYYRSRESLYWDLVRAVNCEVEALVVAGCKLIQLNEQMMLGNKRHLMMALNGLRSIVGREDAYFLVALWYGDYSTVIPEILESAVDGVHFEMANSGFGVLQMLSEVGVRTDVSAGVVKSFIGEVETTDDVREGLSRLLRVVPKERLWLGPDSILRDMSVDDVVSKIRAMVDAAAGER